MAIGMHRPTKRLVDCLAIKTNIKNELARLTDETALFAIVKANGYGHGALKVAEIARDAGATGFCVAILDEALELREAGFKEPILILGVVDPIYIEILLKYNLVTTAPSISWIYEVLANWPALDMIPSLAIHLKIDTGMGRLGLRGTEELQEALTVINNNPQLNLEGVYTHFAKADSADVSYFRMQQARFEEALALIPETVKYIHTSNSATALWHDHWRSNLVRMGVTMYGLNPAGRELTPPYELFPAMSVVTELVQVKLLPEGERISYGGDYTTKTEEWIGTLPIGYGDGLIREFKDFVVEVAGEKAPFVGRICMDQSMIRLPRKLPVGSKVTIFSQDSTAWNDFQTAAEYIGTINYEIPCMIGERVPIEYINDSK